MKDVVVHWKVQRISAIVIFPLFLWFLYSILCMKDFSFDQVYSWFSRPLNTVLTAMFFIFSFLHLKLGLQVIVEDYISDIKQRNFTIFLINIICYVLLFISILALFSMIL